MRLEVSVLRHQGPRRGPHDGLGDEGRHGIGTFVKDRFLELVGALDAALFGDKVEGASVAVARCDVGSVQHERQVVAAPARVAAQCEGAHGVAVIACPPGDDLEFHRVAPVHLVLAGHLHGRLHGLGAAREEIDTGKPWRGHLDDPVGQLDGCLARELGAVGEGDAAGLFQHGLLDLLHAVADVHHRRAAGAVDELPPFLVVDVYALTAVHGGIILGRRPVKDMILVDFLCHGCLLGAFRVSCDKAMKFYQIDYRSQWKRISSALFPLALCGRKYYLSP